ncbi:M43 family zinc metalloprotease [Arthrobacter sp. LjRoot78]|uniref:hypothetical protein n=1 Tax=Arthrobacter sp. LjRoot78 TaxID=3342338 RepID=UPI003ECE0A28
MSNFTPYFIRVAAAFAAASLLVMAGLPAANATTEPAVPDPVVAAPAESGAQRTIVRQSAGVGARAADIKVTLVTAKTRDKTDADVASIDVTKAKAAVTSAGDYWRTISDGKLTISLASLKLGFVTSASSGDNFDVILETITRELGWKADPGQALVVFIPRSDVVVYSVGGNLGAGWSSGATTGRIVMPLTSGFTSPVLAHEFGHVFGLQHANSLDCSSGRADTAVTAWAVGDGECYAREYGDGTDLMGVSQYAQPYLNAALYDYGSFGSGDEIRDLGTLQGSQTVTLLPWASNSAARAVKFQDPGSGETYYVQLRLPVGYDSATAVNGNKGVQILKAGPEPGSSLLLPPSTLAFSGWYGSNLAWQRGGVFTTYAGVQIRVNDITSTSASVTVDSVSPAIVSQLDQAAARNSLGSPVRAAALGLANYGAYRDYQRGTAVWSAASGAYESTGAIRNTWLWSGMESGPLGYPVTDEIGGLVSGGVYQMYQGGAIVWSPVTGAHTSRGAIRVAWGGVGYESGTLGYPVASEVGGLRNGGANQDFQRGSIVWSASTGAKVSTGAIRSTWVWSGLQNGPLGYPYTNEIKGLRDGGAYQMFEGGGIVWSPATGAHVSKGGIRQAWANTGFENGPLGYPTTSEYVGSSGTVIQNFQGGRIVWSPSTGAQVII